jgi:hypothetical protein
MIDKFEFKEENRDEEFALLKYVDTIAKRYTSHISDCYGENIQISAGKTYTASEIPELFEQAPLAYTPYLSNITEIFVERFNGKQLTYYFSYEDYIKNDEIQKSIKYLELDRDKFWFLLLFIYDYSESLCINGYDVAPCANEMLYSMKERIFGNVKNFDLEGGCIMSKETKITLSVKGEKALVIDNPTAIFMLAFMANNFFEKSENITQQYIMNYCPPLPESKSMNDSPHIAFFAKMFLDLFDKISPIVSKRKKGAKHSVKELELVSRLVYFTKLSTNKKLLDIESQTLKAYLKQYKTLNLSLRRSNIYTSFWI